MSFAEILEQYQTVRFHEYFDKVTGPDITRVLEKDVLRAEDFLTLLSPQAAEHIELMAEKAHRLSVQFFGKTIQLFTPLYISNHCSNNCIYCGFNSQNPIKRQILTIDEIEREAGIIASTGIQHVLLLTGESRQATPMDYLVEAVTCLRNHFSSISIEIFPLEEDEYRQLQMAGVDGLTLFQEVYDRTVYDQVHLAGKKRDYRFRLDGPERGARAGFRLVNIGALLGLGENRSEMFFTGLHAAYLEQQFLHTEISISLPRFSQAECSYKPHHPVDDRTFVQFLLALRLFMPRCGITISTRERAHMRDHLVRLGATRYSAGVCTSVGGYGGVEQEDSTPQFDITDGRSVAEVADAISANGYQPVYKDWDRII